MSKYTNPTRYCWGIDVSHYRPKVDWKALKTEGCAFGLAKASESYYLVDDAFAAHVDGAYWADIPMGAYHFIDPQYYTQFPLSDKSKWPAPANDPQLQNYVHQLKNKRLYFQVLDVERWWVDYDEYYEFRRGQRELKNVRKIPALWIIETTRVFAGRMADAFPHLPLFIYSRNSFIDEFATIRDANGKVTASLHDVIAEYGSFPAYYPQSSAVVSVPSWAYFWENYAPPDELFYGNYVHGGPPWMGNKPFNFWQFTGDKYEMPYVCDNTGAKKTTDINIYNGSAEALWQRIGFVPGQLPQPKPEPTGHKWRVRSHALLGVKVRTLPNADAPKAGESLKRGEIVEATDYAFGSNTNWIKHGRGWSALDGLLEAVE